jgi:hypothetical protein
VRDITFAAGAGTARAPLLGSVQAVLRLTNASSVRHPSPVGCNIFSSLVGFIGHLGYELWRYNVEVTKALAALQPLYGKDNVEIVTMDGQRVRGVVRSMKTTQALTTPSVKMECANGEIVKIPFPTIAEIKDHNSVGSGQ